MLEEEGLEIDGEEQRTGSARAPVPTGARPFPERGAASGLSPWRRAAQTVPRCANIAAARVADQAMVPRSPPIIR